MSNKEVRQRKTPLKQATQESNKILGFSNKTSHEGVETIHTFSGPVLNFK